jgi:NAD(P)-dependent dehydrogenase (short-subunit alcohol dehydrogenase family)
MRSTGDELVIPPGMERLRGRVAVVTGASSGVGWAVCEALVAAGLRVVGASRRKERLQALQSHVIAAGAGGKMFLPVMCDVTKEEEVRTLMSMAVKTFAGRPVSILVNAAGMKAPDGSLMAGKSKSWIEMLSTNVLAVAMCSREACISMKRIGQWGHIINLGALVGAISSALCSAIYGARLIAMIAFRQRRVSSCWVSVAHATFGMNEECTRVADRWR